MGLHVYCILPAGHVPDPSVTGVGARAVRSLDCADLALWVSDLERPPTASAEAVLAHNAVIASGITAAVTPVPSRFGQWFNDDIVAAAAIAGVADRWRELLRRVAGHVEFGVRVSRAAEAPTAREMHPAPASGTEYLAGLARRERQVRAWRDEADRLSARIAHRAGPVIAGSRTEAAVGDVLSLAHLVAHQNVAAYHSILRDVRADEPTLKFLSTGPWPPYSFAG